MRYHSHCTTTGDSWLLCCCWSHDVDVVELKEVAVVDDVVADVANRGWMLFVGLSPELPLELLQTLLWLGLNFHNFLDDFAEQSFRSSRLGLDHF